MKAESTKVQKDAVSNGRRAGRHRRVTDAKRHDLRGWLRQAGVLGDDADMTLDTVVWYASMTKALVATGAMQLVEHGRVSLDEPIARVVPGLASPQVLDGFDGSGRPILRPAKRPITLRHLLTHTSGFGYDIWNANVDRYMRENAIPLLVDCKLSSLGQPLAVDPGESWEYGISIDWVGQVVEAVSGMSLEAYLASHLFAPLGMSDTAFIIRPDVVRAWPRCISAIPTARSRRSSTRYRRSRSSSWAAAASTAPPATTLPMCR